MNKLLQIETEALSIPVEIHKIPQQAYYKSIKFILFYLKNTKTLMACPHLQTTTMYRT